MRDAATVTIHFANFLAYITSLFHMGGSFHDLVQRKHQSNPSSVDKPWSLLLYCDELVPGNVLARAERKLWAIYGTFHELGQEALSHEDVWLTISLERSTFAAQLPGGIGQIFGKVLAEPRGGLLLKSPYVPNIRLHFIWGICLADGAAHKQVWASKGDAGTKFCLLCANVHSAATMAAGQDVIDHGTTKYHQLHLTTPTMVSVLPSLGPTPENMQQGGLQPLAAGRRVDMECQCPPVAPATVVQRPHPTSAPRNHVWRHNQGQPAASCGVCHPELPGGRLRRPRDEEMAWATPPARFLAKTWDIAIHIHHRAKAQDNWQACHQFAEDDFFRKLFMEIITLKEPGLFPDSCQLVKPKKATKQQLQVLRDLVDAPANEALVASSAKLAKGGTIHAHDVVVFHHQDGRWELGQVWFHLELGARKVTLL
eukprot:s4431_g3.t1